MATGGQRRTRSERVAALEMPRSRWERAWDSLRQRDVWGRIALALLASVAMCCIIAGWNPPFNFRVGEVPNHDVVARAGFQQADPAATDLARRRARAQVRYIYEQDSRPLADLRGQLRNALIEVGGAETLDKLNPKVWQSFALPAEAGDKLEDTPVDQTAEQKTPEEQYQEFRAAVSSPDALEQIERSLQAALAPFEQRGLLESAPEDKALGPGNPDEIIVHPRGKPEPLQMPKVSDVLIGNKGALRQSLREHFESPVVADRLYGWLSTRLTATLSLDRAATQRAMDEAAAAVPMQYIVYAAGTTLVRAGEVINPEQLQLLKLEYKSTMDKRLGWAKALRALAVTMMIFALFVACGIYMIFRQRGPLTSFTRTLVLVLMALATVALARWAAAGQLNIELLPLMIFGMTIAIVYRQELATILTAVVAFIIALGIGHGLFEFALLFCAASVANLSLGEIRTRGKLILVGLAAGVVAAVLTVALALINDQPLGSRVIGDALFTGLWAVGAGFIIFGLLPAIEKLFGVLTDLSLLELGDVTHPLLRELVRRAPSTYNHSLTVGAIAEAAADSIGARGLLCRVGAYFHDIGKMLKPAYFVENQGTEQSRHDGLLPAMSTLVIVAHIKDGSDLARQHSLPQPITDMIAQHHGTTLIEYFYDRAHERSQTDPNGGEVDEKLYRYPGPKPQTKEAAVLMLADAVESASRTLVDPAPSRIEGLVRSIAERRLHDGQFDESGLTLRELRTIERSLVMTLTSIYHGRIKYPEQRTA